MWFQGNTDPVELTSGAWEVVKILAHDDKNEIVLVAFTGAVIKILYFRKSLPLLLQSVQIWKQFFDMNRDNEQLFTSNLFAEYVWDTTLLIVSSAIRLNYLYHQFYCSNTNDKYFSQIFHTSILLFMKCFSDLSA